MDQNLHNNSRYWLMDEEPKGIANHLINMHSEWAMWTASPVKQAWARNYLAYYSPVLHPGSWDSSLIFEGVQGELTRFYTPKARVLTRQLVSIVTKQRLAFQPSAFNHAEADVIQDLKIASAVAEELTQTERLDMKDNALVEGAIVCGNWFTKTVWRTDKGEPYTRGDHGEVVYKGGVEISLASVFDVFYDSSIPDWERMPWVEVRTTKNRWDLIAQHPDMRTEILSIPSVRLARGAINGFDSSLTDDDMIFVYEFFSRPSPACPKGKMMMYATEKCIFHHGDNQYGTLPVEPLMPEQILGTGVGYPQFTNIIASQEMFDNSLSAIATNQSQFAVQSVAVARGADVNVMELNGMRFVKYTPQQVPGGGVPTPLQLTQSSPETFKFTEMLDRQMQDMSQLNGALRGNPGPGITSGVAIATLSANAIEFLNTISLARTNCWEKTMMHAVNAHVRFGKLEQLATFKGKNSQVMQKSFKGQNLRNIRAMHMNLMNPLMQTVAGRLEIGEKLMTMPKEVWPQYCSILEGRPLSDIYKGDLSQQDLIELENDWLQQGKEVHALATDDHARHISCHAALLNDPQIRTSGQHLDGILKHIEEHKNLAQNSDPFLMAMIRTGKMPEGAQQQQAPQGQEPPPGLMPPQGGGAPQGEQGPSVPQALQPPQYGPQRPGMPIPPEAAPLPMTNKVAPEAKDLLGRASSTAG